MLVLSRKVNEAIIVAGGEIVIRVVDIRGDKVRIGVEAGRDIPVHREEVHLAMEREAKEAERKKEGGESSGG